MFNLIIQSFFKAQDILDTRWPTKAVSINSPDVECYKRGDHHLIAVFDDCVEDCFDPDGIWRVAPKLDDMRAILDFTATFTDDDNVLIHCRAGKSRSTAVAIGALVQHGRSPQEALAHVCTLRPVVIPNTHMIEMIDHLLELGGELNKVVEKHYEKFPIIGGPPLTLLGFRHQIDD